MSAAIREKIAEYSAVVESQDENVTARIKKRAYQKLGKLKKELFEAEQIVVTTPLSVLSGQKRKGPSADTDCDEDVKTSTAANDVPTVNRKAIKAQLRMLNQELAVFAQKKQLKFACKKFEHSVGKGVPVDIHSYTNLMNAHVRCNDLDGANRVLQRMRAAGIKPNVITYTILIKGYCELGLIEAARNLFFKEMQAEECMPNLRTLNALLRGATRVGAVTSALEAFQYYQQTTTSVAVVTVTHSKVHSQGKVGASSVNLMEEDAALQQPDASTFEYLMGLLCRACRLDDALLIMSDIATAPTSSSSSSSQQQTALGNAAIYLWLGKVYALLGLLSESRKWLVLSDNCREMSKSSKNRADMQKKFSNSMNGAGGGGGGGGGGGRWGDDGPSKSVELFLQHRNSELEQESEAIKEFLSMCATSSSSGGGGDAAAVATEVSLSVSSSYIDLLSRVLYFGFDGCSDLEPPPPQRVSVTAATAAAHASASAPHATATTPDDSGNDGGTNNIAAQLLFALRDKFGLDEINQYVVRAAAATAAAGGSGGSTTRTSAAATAAQRTLKNSKRSLSVKLIRSIDNATGHINMLELFGLSTAISSDASTMQQLPPIKMEICSGNGEWVVAQARVDAVAAAAVSDTFPGQQQQYPKALWLALELRCDRVHNIMCSKLFSKAATPISGANSTDGATACADNFAVLGGDASKILPRHLAPSCISQLFINHPQPPDHLSRLANGSGGGAASASGTQSLSQGQHLLTADFFSEMHRVLKDQGTITIESDNLSYMQLLASILCSSAAAAAMERPNAKSSASNSSCCFASAVVEEQDDSLNYDGNKRSTRSLQEKHLLQQLVPFSPKSSTSSTSDDGHLLYAGFDRRVAVVGSSSSSSRVAGMGKTAGGSHRSNCVIEIWRGEPGAAEGHNDASASSYFDRMWSLGQKKRRWFMFLRKI